MPQTTSILRSFKMVRHNRTARRSGWNFPSILQSVPASRKNLIIVVSIVFAHLLSASMGISYLQCPIKAILKIPCPGCGLTTATVQLLTGQWETAVITHAFVPLFAIVFLFSVSACFFPNRYLLKTHEMICEMEKRTGFTVIAITAIVAYWLCRVTHAAG